MHSGMVRHARGWDALRSLVGVEGKPGRGHVAGSERSHDAVVSRLARRGIEIHDVVRSLVQTAALKSPPVIGRSALGRSTLADVLFWDASALASAIRREPLPPALSWAAPLATRLEYLRSAALFKTAGELVGSLGAQGDEPPVQVARDLVETSNAVLTRAQLRHAFAQAERDPDPTALDAVHRAARLLGEEVPGERPWNRLVRGVARGRARGVPSDVIVAHGSQLISAAGRLSPHAVQGLRDFVTFEDLSQRAERTLRERLHGIDVASPRWAEHKRQLPLRSMAHGAFLRAQVAAHLLEQRGAELRDLTGVSDALAVAGELRKALRDGSAIGAEAARLLATVVVLNGPPHPTGFGLEALTEGVGDFLRISGRPVPRGVAGVVARVPGPREVQRVFTDVGSRATDAELFDRLARSFPARDADALEPVAPGRFTSPARLVLLAREAPQDLVSGLIDVKAAQLG